MGKRRIPSPSSPGLPEAPPTPAPTSPQWADMDRRLDRGDSGGARRLARNVLKAPPDAGTGQRAREILAITRMDPLPLAVFLGMVLVMLVVFFNAIVRRNHALEKLPSPVQVEKSLVPHPLPAPPQQQGEPRGTP